MPIAKILICLLAPNFSLTHTAYVINQLWKCQNLQVCLMDWTFSGVIVDIHLCEVWQLSTWIKAELNQREKISILWQLYISSNQGQLFLYKRMTRVLIISKVVSSVKISNESWSSKANSFSCRLLTRVF